MEINYSKVYFIGIGGIGMSSIALYFLNSGKLVAGYDKTKTDLTQTLINNGVHINFNLNNIPSDFMDCPNTLIVYTPAISNDNIQLDYLKRDSLTFAGKVIRQKKTGMKFIFPFEGETFHMFSISQEPLEKDHKF